MLGAVLLPPFVSCDWPGARRWAACVLQPPDAQAWTAHAPLHKPHVWLAQGRPPAPLVTGPATAAAVAVPMLGGAGGGAAPAPWGSLFDPAEQALTNPGVAWTLGRRSKQLLYPPWLEGTWQVHDCP